MILLLIKTEELKDLGLEVSNTTPRQEISGRTDWFEGTKYFLSLEEGERLAGDLLRMIEHCKRFTQHDRPIVDMKEWTTGLIKEGKPLIVIEPGSSSSEVVEQIRKVLPDNHASCVHYISFDQKE